MGDPPGKKSLGQIAYEGWWKHYVDKEGIQPPQDFSQLPDIVRECWEEAAIAVNQYGLEALKYLEETTFSEREANEIKFARAYASSFLHGTDGHIRLVIIAKYSSMIRPLLIRREG